jgi:hypothetical protein
MIGPATIGCSAQPAPRAGICGSFSRWWLGFHSSSALTKGDSLCVVAESPGHEPTGSSPGAITACTRQRWCSPIRGLLAWIIC